MMDATAAATISHQLGTQPATPTTLLAARELAACGCFKRAAFLRGLAQQAAEQPPLQLMQTLDRLCHEAGLFAPAQLLHDLLPTPQQAADLIHQAACSQAVCGALIHSSCWGRVCASTTASDCALQAVLRLLQSLLVCSFDAAACGTADPAACDTALQQYVLAMLQHLQEAAARQEVLAVCLLQAAASCGVLCDEAAVASWAHKQLCQQLQCKLQPLAPAATAAAAAATTPSSFLSPQQPATPHSSATALPETSWPSLALQPLCWTLLLPALLQCMPAQGVLELLQAHLSTAAGSVTGLAQMCDVVAALDASGCGVQAAGMVSQSLAASLAAGDTRGTLAVLLLAGHLLRRGAWGKGQYLGMLQQAGTTLQEGHAGSALPALLKAFNVLLPTADSAVLQAQLDFLRQLQPQLGPVLQGEVSKATAILRDVLAVQQQLARQEQQGKQGGRAVGRAALDEYNRLLDQYMQLPRNSTGSGGRLTQVLLARWKLMGAAPAFCEAFTQQPPESVDRARACLAYMQELQAARLCKPEQVDAFKASCLVFGLDLSAQQQQQQQQQQRPGAPADPVAALKGLLDRLPVVVSAGSRPGLAALLARIKEHLTRILQLQQPAQQQQHPQQQHAPAWLGAAGEPASKKQRTAEAAAAAAGADTQITELLDALLSAYAAASASPPAAATDGSWDWRVELLGVLQELPLLHGPLLQRLLGSLCGSAWPQEVAPQQALWHGSLLAWLSASKLQQAPVLAQGAAGESEAGVTAAPMAAPLFTWQCCSSSSSCSSSYTVRDNALHPQGTDQGEKPAAGSLQGCQLVQLLASCTRVASPHARCCASFWAGYVGCVKTHMSQWSAGPHAGPFGSRSTANTSPGVLTALTQPPQDTGAQQQQLVAYVPPQLAVLLRQLAAELTRDVQAAAAGGAAAAAGQGAVTIGADSGAVSYDVAASALQVCTRALKVQAVKWVCQLYRV